MFKKILVAIAGDGREKNVVETTCPVLIIDKQEVLFMTDFEKLAISESMDDKIKAASDSKCPAKIIDQIIMDTEFWILNF